MDYSNNQNFCQQDLVFLHALGPKNKSLIRVTLAKKPIKIDSVGVFFFFFLYSMFAFLFLSMQFQPVARFAVNWALMLS